MSENTVHDVANRLLASPRNWIIKKHVSEQELVADVLP
jgi:hypothetical protein